MFSLQANISLRHKRQNISKEQMSDSNTEVSLSSCF